MYKLTFIHGKSLHTLTLPGLSTALLLRKFIPNSRLWKKDKLICCGPALPQPHNRPVSDWLMELVFFQAFKG
jgi:hypothetical protein